MATTQRRSSKRALVTIDLTVAVGVVLMSAKLGKGYRLLLCRTRVLYEMREQGIKNGPLLLTSRSKEG